MVGPCPECQKEVLTSRDLVGEEIVDRCLHCESLLPRKTLRWSSPKAVVALGYIIEGYQDEHSQDEGSRGCRGGACGVQQPV